MSLAVVTVVHGRHRHLALQRDALARSSRLPDLHVVVAMDDPAVEDVVADGRLPTRVLHVPRAADGLPLAAARNAGVAAARADGATTLVLLDVDCLPSTTLLTTYARVAADPATRDDLLCGPVTYLPPAPPQGYDLDTVASLGTPHAARPAPAAGTVLRTSDHRLFWSLSFALTTRTWDAVGGFDEAYVGYGGEDTDFARRAERAGLGLTWVGGADAFHQHHPVSSPPVEHVRDVVRNATLFFERWGTWPMEGWLDAFVERGLVERRADGTYACLRADA